MIIFYIYFFNDPIFFSLFFNIHFRFTNQMTSFRTVFVILYDFRTFIKIGSIILPCLFSFRESNQSVVISSVFTPNLLILCFFVFLLAHSIFKSSSIESVHLTSVFFSQYILDQHP